jgi:hypothetical protein
MYIALLTLIGNVCGIAAKEVVRAQLRVNGVARAALLREHVDGERNMLKKAYLLIDILFMPTFVRAIWPHMTVTERDLRNRLRTACPDFNNASASGWGFQRTYNPRTHADPSLPMLLHGFGLNKEVLADDPGWQRFRTGPSATAGKMMVRPALRSMQNPNVIENLVLSCSLVSNAKCSTASPVGFILNAPCWNIFGLAPRDIQFANDTAATMNALTQSRGIGLGRNNLSLSAAHEDYTTLAALIAETTGLGGDSHYNEIVVLGTSRLYLCKTQATGLFVKVASVQGRDCLVDSALSMGMEELDRTLRFYHDRQVIDAIIACSNTFNLPVVPIRDPAMQDRATDIDFVTTFATCRVQRDWQCALT